VPTINPNNLSRGNPVVTLRAFDSHRCVYSRKVVLCSAGHRRASYQIRLLFACVGKFYNLLVPESDLTTTVTYHCGTDPALGSGWEVMRVVVRREDGERNSFVIARDPGGKIIRKTDLILDRWEVVNDEELLRQCKHCFDEKDRLAAEKAANMEKVTDHCKCGHPFSSHTRDIHESGAMKVDDALLPDKKYDIFSDRPAGESGCTECDCSQWKPAAW